MIEHAKQSANKLLRLVRRRRLGAASSFVVAGAIGRRPCDTYLRYRSWNQGSKQEISVRGQHMIVDLDDQGMSRDLLLYGIREEATAERFDRELAVLGASDEPVRIIDIGANIGYYTLIEA